MKRLKFFKRIGTIVIIIFLEVGCTVNTTALTSTPTDTPTVTPIVQVITSTPSPAATATMQAAVFVWKITGDPNPFSSPIGVAVDAEGNIYVMDAGNSRVQKFDNNGKFLLMWGSKGNGDGQFDISIPDEGIVAVDGEGNVYVGDANNYRIQKFDLNGKFLLKWGSKGTGDGLFREIVDIAFDKQNNVYVSDYQNNTVQKFDSNGKFLLSWGRTGSSAGEFSGAGSVMIDNQGNVLVADIFLGRIEKFDRNGQFLSQYLLPIVSNNPIYPYSIALDSQGNFYISDNPSYRIVKLDSNLNLLAVWGSKGESIGQFMNMHTIRVDGEGNVYVTDSLNNCVQKLRQPSFHLQP